ncbi:MAG: acireductone dioxygenase [Myxococcota bacterium]
MAMLRSTEGLATRDLTVIQETFVPLMVRVEAWPTAPEVHLLLNRPILSEEDKERILTGHDAYFRKLQKEHGYRARDLIVLHSEVPNLEAMLARFERCHTHDDDEVRYIVDGEGVFGFVMPDETQVHLTVQTGEFINVPAGTEHWFYLTESRRIKAIRYFTQTEGWVPVYTDTPIRPLAA